MKKTFLVLFSLMLVFAIGSNAEALSVFNFSGSSNGGTGSATMDISTSGSTLTVVVDNTSPTGLDNDESLLNFPGIVAFGFDLTNDPLPTIVDWSLEAQEYDTVNDVLTTLTIGNMSNPSLWDILVNDTNGLEGVKREYLPNTPNPSQGNANVDGALYNPALFDDPDFQYSDLGQHTSYFTTATLTITFNSAPVLDPDIAPYVRMQRVGQNASGSLKLYGTPGPPIPEPTTILLVGLGLLGIAGFRKKLRK